jgi:predicted lipid-binding transport protein (Tim44 family)
MTRFLTSTICSLAILLIVVGDADAARMGGGKSFGSRPSFSAPYQRSQGVSGSGMSRPAGQQQGYSAAQQRNQSMRDSLAQRGGMTRFLGGLALGGLLGAMFFGGGFEHINFLDILIFGGIAFMLFKFLAARRSSASAAATPTGDFRAYERGGDGDAGYDRRPVSAGFNTDIMSGKAGGPIPVTPDAMTIPSDFEAAAFLEGAKSAYRMMQNAWDSGDLADLRGLTTDKVFAELQDQLRSRGDAHNQTDLLKVDAEVLEVRDVGQNREVAVLFDVLMRETPDARPGQVREVWHFTRSRNSRQPTWFLDGIQQMEE